MSTRSLTVIKDEEGKEIVTMYRQSDGYPTGHGKDLAAFLTGVTIVNGIGGGTPAKAANGMGCLAAQIVAHFKDGIGGIYLHRFQKSNVEDYLYIVSGYGEGLGVRLTVYDTCAIKKQLLYDGLAGEFNAEKVEALTT